MELINQESVPHICDLIQFISEALSIS
jgi:hypothetical protein